MQYASDIWPLELVFSLLPPALVGFLAICSRSFVLGRYSSWYLVCHLALGLDTVESDR